MRRVQRGGAGVRSPNIEDDLFVRERRRQHLTRLVGACLVVGNEEHGLQAVRHRHALGDPILLPGHIGVLVGCARSEREWVAPERDLEPAVDRRRDVVRVALLVRRELQQQLLRRRRREVLAAEREAGGEARDERRRRRAHPARRRHGVLALEAQRDHRLPQRRQPLLDALDDQILLRRHDPVGALALDFHRELVGALDDQPVPHVHRQPERVEPRAHVGGRRRHVNVHAVDGLVERLLDRLDPRGSVSVGLVSGRGERTRRAAHERRGRADQGSTHCIGDQRLRFRCSSAASFAARRFCG